MYLDRMVSTWTTGHLQVNLPNRIAVSTESSLGWQSAQRVSWYFVVGGAKACFFLNCQKGATETLHCLLMSRGAKKWARRFIKLTLGAAEKLTKLVIIAFGGMDNWQKVAPICSCMLENDKLVYLLFLSIETWKLLLFIHLGQGKRQTVFSIALGQVKLTK